MKNDDLSVQGFRAAAGRAGIRGKDRLDVGLIFSETPAQAAAVFTTNLVKAAPVLLDMEHIAGGLGQAIVVNSGIANACTGAPGLALARGTARLTGELLGIPQEHVLVASTGVIGMPLELDIFERIMPTLVKELSPDGVFGVVQAMMTTDTVPKTAVRTVELGGKAVKLVGMAKGAGMIMPNMATMLGFILTDAAVDAKLLKTMLKQGVDKSFNVITVDGDSSTNDTVLLLANGRANNPLLTTDSSPDAQIFQAALNEVMKDLALQIVADGEGATKFITIRVDNARTPAEAEQAARTVANSPLVKTAFFGQDANWGRIIAALGRSGADFNPDQVDISFDAALMVRDGLGLGKAAEVEASKVLQQKRFTVRIDLKAGSAGAEVYTCDLSLDYIKINADYRS